MYGNDKKITPIPSPTANSRMTVNVFPTVRGSNHYLWRNFCNEIKLSKRTKVKIRVYNSDLELGHMLD